MSIIIEKVRKFLQKEGYNPINSPHSENIIIVEGLNGLNEDTDGISFNIEFFGMDGCLSRDDGGFDLPTHLIATSKFPEKVPSDKREKMISLFNEINFVAEAAWIALNMENGEIYCKSIIKSRSIDAINDDILGHWYTAPWEKLDALYPSIIDAIYSEKSVEHIFEEIQRYYL